MLSRAIKEAVERKFVKSGELVVATMDEAETFSGGTNTMKIITVP